MTALDLSPEATAHGCPQTQNPGVSVCLILSGFRGDENYKDFPLGELRPDFEKR